MLQAICKPRFVFVSWQKNAHSVAQFCKYYQVLYQLDFFIITYSQKSHISSPQAYLRIAQAAPYWSIEAQDAQSRGIPHTKVPAQNGANANADAAQ